MATYSELQTRVQRRLIDLPAAVLAEVPDLINEALREIQRRHNFKVMEAVSSTYTTSVGVRTLSAVIPTDWKEARDRPYLVEDDDFDYVRELQWGPNKNAIIRRFANLDEGAPEFLLDPLRAAADGAGTFEVWPLPDGNSDYDDGEYRIIVPYWKFLPALSGSSDSNWFTINAERFLIYKATADGFFVDWDEQRAAFWEQKAANELSQMILHDKHTQLAPIDTLVPYRGAKTPQLGA